MALMLSLMVVYLSVGTTVTHCLSYGKVTVGTVADCCVKRSMDHDCCQGKPGTLVKKHCMDVKQVKLSPTVSIQHLDFDAAPVFAGIVPALWQMLPHPVICSIQKARYWNQNVPHSPPRAYLALLNTLIIWFFHICKKVAKVFLYFCNQNCRMPIPISKILGLHTYIKR